MKPIALFFIVALIPAAVMAAHAKTITPSQGNADQKSVAGVAGPAMAAQNSNHDEAASKRGPAGRASVTHPSKQSLKKVKVTPPPPMHDPN
ncbi:MAG TPA: hypothetical protein VGH23_07705 [Rhizomicrobium sp.]